MFKDWHSSYAIFSCHSSGTFYRSDLERYNIVMYILNSLMFRGVISYKKVIGKFLGEDEISFFVINKLKSIKKFIGLIKKICSLVDQNGFIYGIKDQDGRWNNYLYYDKKRANIGEMIFNGKILKFKKLKGGYTLFDDDKIKEKLNDLHNDEKDF